jgi:hypothetical protein
MPAIPMHEVAERNRNAFEATAELYRLLRNGVMPNQLAHAWQRVLQCAAVTTYDAHYLLYLFNTYELDDWLSNDLWSLLNNEDDTPEFRQDMADIEALVKQIEAAIADGAAVAST